MRRYPWLWPAIIVLSTAAAALVTFEIAYTPLRPFIVLWFLFVCPGMALVLFFHLEETVVEWVLALALSIAIDAIVAGILLYAGRWSPPVTLGILMGLSLGGVILHIGLTSFTRLKRRIRHSNKSDDIGRLERSHLSACTCGYVDDRLEARFCPHCGRPKSGQTHLPPSIQPLIDAYLNALEPLRSHFYGIYIFGSIALGSFEERESDIDIIALTQGEWTTPELAQLKALHTQLMRRHRLGKRLEVLYLPLRNLGKRNEEIAPYPGLHTEKFTPAGYGDLNYVTWWALKNKSICLLGPDRSTLPLEVAWQDVLETMRDNLDGYWASNAKRPYRFLLDGWIEFSVSTLCRILTTIEEEEIITKSAALKRWRNRLPTRWSLLIDEAWRIRHHLPIRSLYRSRFKRMKEALAFIEYVRERGNKGLKASSQR